MRDPDPNSTPKLKSTPNDPTSLIESFSNLRLTKQDVPPELFSDLCHLVHGGPTDSDKGLEHIVPELNLPISAYRRLKELHARWRKRSNGAPAS